MTKNRFHTGRIVIVGAILAAIIFVCVNIVSAHLFRSARIDLTQQNLYSLSQGTKQLLGQIQEPVRFRFFMSSGLTKEAPQLAAFSQRLRSMLDSYVAGSNGKIILETIDPKPYSEEEDRAVAFGVSPIRSQSGDRMFFGLAATNSTDGKAVIGSFSPEREAFLEYDLTRLVSELGRRGKPVVALFDGLGMSGNPQMGQREQQVLTQMKQFFDVTLVQGDADKLPENTRVVMVVHPQNIGEKALYAIDQWALSGGATLVFVDPNAENQIGPRGAPPPDASSNLPEALRGVGRGLRSQQGRRRPRLCAADRAQRQRAPDADDQPALARHPQRRPAQGRGDPRAAVRDRGDHRRRVRHQQGRRHDPPAAAGLARRRHAAGVRHEGSHDGHAHAAQQHRARAPLARHRRPPDRQPRRRLQGPARRDRVQGRASAQRAPGPPTSS